MKINKKDIILIVVPLIIIAAIYPFLPDMIPRQFDFQGHASSYMRKEFLFLSAFLPYIVYKSYQMKRGK